MKVFVVLSGLLCLALGEAPYPASGWKPSGALLVLPSRQLQLSNLESQLHSRQEQPPTAYGPPQPNNTNQDEAAESGNNGVVSAEQLQQREGAQVGAYYVLLPDGRLQRIEYATAPAAPGESKATENQGTPQQNTNTFGQQSFQNTFNGQNFQARQNSRNLQVEQTQRQNAFGQQNFQRTRFGQAPQENLGFGQATNNVNTFQQPQQSAFQAQQSAFQTQQNAFQPQQSAFQAQQNAFQAQQNAFQPQRNAFQNQQNSFPNQQNSFRNTAGQQTFQQSSEQNLQKTSSQATTQSTDDKSQAVAPPNFVAQFSEAQLKANGPLPDGFVASVQFSDVPPITAPVYVFNPAPLVRVLRMTP